MTASFVIARIIHSRVLGDSLRDLFGLKLLGSEVVNEKFKVLASPAVAAM